MALPSLRGLDDHAANGEAVDGRNRVECAAVLHTAGRGRMQRLIAARVNERLFSAAPTKLRIGRFTILDEIGRGGMGLVYSAYDEQLDRKVAIKVPLNESSNHEARRRFLREGQAMARITHPNVVSVHEVGDSDGQPFLAMELIRGQNLYRWVRTQPSWRELIEAFVQVGQGLIAAHQAGLVHSDLKPSNIMRSDDGVVKILDFGIARAMDDVRADSCDGRDTSDEASASTSASASVSASASALPLTAPCTRTGVLMGTPAYMAPEQLCGRSTDARSDQFSFCIVLYEALYGERPFHGGSIDVLMREIRSSSIEPGPRGSKVPRSVRKAVLRGLAHDPAERWPSMEELLEPLRREIAPRRGRIGLRLALGLLGIGASLGGQYGAWSNRCMDAKSHLACASDQERPLREQVERVEAPLAMDRYDELDRLEPQRERVPPPEDPTMAPLSDAQR